MFKHTALSALVLLLLAGCVSQARYNQNKYQDQAYEALNQALAEEVASDQAQILQLEDRIKVVMVDEFIFPEGGWQVGRGGKAVLDKLVPVLQNLVNLRVEVQGFTDNVPIGPELKHRFPSNWELSTARATDVVRYLVSRGVDPALLSANGFGDEWPVASNSTPEGRRLNRRIEIVLLNAATP